jgi:serine/threonine-protein kinase
VSQIDTEFWKRLDALLEEALSLPTEERAAWLERLGPDHPMRERLADMLSRTGDESSAFMGRPVGAGTLGEAAETLVSDKAGDEVGPYRLIEALGSGGMGAVWRAEPVEGGVQRQVALKLPRTGWTPGLAGRLQRECAILAKLEHPNIARLYDAGLTEAGRPWLAMQVIAGVPIDRYCREHQLTVAARLRLFLAVARAISYAHARLVVHRDLKPSNIMVDIAGQVHVVDFGLAKVLDDTTDRETAITQTVARTLTPDYASPEQIRGDAITVATDVYSLGVVLYQLLAEKRPYRLKRDSAAALEAAIVEADIPPASSQVADRARARALRGDLDTILAKALRKEVEERYPTVEAFATDVDRYLRRLPIHARPPSFAYYANRFVRRHRTAVAGATVAVLALVAGLAGTLYQAHRAEAERDRAVRELRFAEGSDEFMRFLLSEQSGKPVPAAELLRRAERSASLQFADDPALRARMQMLITDLYGELGDFKRAETVIGVARRSAEAAGDRWLLIQADCVLAAVYGATGRNKEALELYAKVMPPVEADPGADPRTAQICYSQRSLALRNDGRADDSANDARAALASIEASRGGYRVNRIFLKTNVAEALTNAGRLREAVTIYEDAVVELGQIGRGGTSAGLLLTSNLLVMLSRAGQPLKGIEVYGKAATGDDPDPPAFTSLQVNYARLLYEAGRGEEADRILEDARRAKTGMGDARGEAFAVLTAATVACHLRQDAVRCDALREEAARKLDPMLPPKHSVRASIEFLAGRAATARGDTAGARTALEKSAAMYEAAPDRNFNAIRALSELAVAQQEAGDGAAARATAAKAVDAARRATSGFEHSEWLGSALVAQAAVHAAQGDAAARGMLEEGRRNLLATVGPQGPALARADSVAQKLPS